MKYCWWILQKKLPSYQLIILIVARDLAETNIGFEVGAVVWSETKWKFLSKTSAIFVLCREYVETFTIRCKSPKISSTSTKYRICPAKNGPLIPPKFFKQSAYFPAVRRPKTPPKCQSEAVGARPKSAICSHVGSSLHCRFRPQTRQLISTTTR